MNLWIASSDKFIFSRPGYEDQMRHLNDQKELALRIREAQDPKYDPFREYKKEKGGWMKYIKGKFQGWF